MLLRFLNIFVTTILFLLISCFNHNTNTQLQLPSYSSYCDPILNSLAKLIAINSNSLIQDIILLIPSNKHNINLTKCLYNYFQIDPSLNTTNGLDLIFLSVQVCEPLGKKSLLKQSTFSNNNGKVLIVDACEIGHKNNSNNSRINTDFEFVQTPYSNSIYLLIILGPALNKFLKVNEIYIKKSGLNHFYIGELLMTSRSNETIVGGIDVYELFRATSNGKLLSTYKFSSTSIITTDDDDNNSLVIQRYFAKNPLISEQTLANFQKDEFRIGGVMSSDYAYDTNITIRTIGNTTYYQFHDSFAVEILRVLEFSLNFTLKTVVADSWGHYVSSDNKTWSPNSLISQLLENQIDLGISSTANRPFRKAVVEFNLPTNDIRLSVFFHAPTTSSSSTNGILQPFSTVFWFILIVWICLAGLTLIVFRTIMSHHNISLDDNNGNGNETAEYWTNTDSFQWVLSSLCLQSYSNLPSHNCYRIVIGIGYLLSVIVFSAYSGVLISFLSVIIEPIKNLHQLLETKFKFSVVDSPLPLQFLAESQNDYTKQIYNRVQGSPKYETMSSIVPQLVHGSFAFLVDHINGYESLHADFSIEEACGIREFEIPFARQKQGSMISKNSTARRIIDYQILRTFEHGLITKWRRKYLQAKPNCAKNSESHRNHLETGVDLQRLSLVFQILIGGTMLALFLVGIEYCFALRIKNKSSDISTITTTYINKNYNKKVNARHFQKTNSNNNVFNTFII